tara:strand:+ start:6117 stop:6425 length:309 start_codon:yes stop_codon:yes gene_type:complete
MWFTLFIISSLLNILLFLYVRWLLKTITAINQDIETLTSMLSEFSAHVKGLYELEMFYGDETLRSLLDHSKRLVDAIEDIDLVLNEEKEEEVQIAAEAAEEN